MKLSELFYRSGIKMPNDTTDTEITVVTGDSRRIIPGGVFVCLPGTKRNCYSFIDDAKSRGAVAVITQTDVEGSNVTVDDARIAMSELCFNFNGCQNGKMRFVAVTGTNGKTTVVSLLRSICEASGKLYGSIGTLGCYIGHNRINAPSHESTANMTTPDPEELYRVINKMESARCEYVFMEASSHSLAQKKLVPLIFDVGIFTNLSRDHLDFHGDFSEYAKSKQSLKELCKRFVVNADDANCSLFMPGSLTCSMKSRADHYATYIRRNEIKGYTYKYNSCKSAFNIKTLMPGEYSVMNTLEAAATAELLGFCAMDIAAGIYNLRKASGRMEKVGLSLDADISVYIDYAHTPAALLSVLNSASSMTNGRVVVLFGCGGDRDKGKRAEMGKIATENADYSVITSDNSRSEDTDSIIEDIVSGIDGKSNYTVIKDRRSAIEYAIRNSKPNDLIILAGKGHEKYEIDNFGRHEFDEAEIVRKAWLDK